jgi:hypothetical protein
MSILNYGFGTHLRDTSLVTDNRYERDALGDLKHGLDLIFALKEELDKLHPIAAETLKRLLSN